MRKNIFSRWPLAACIMCMSQLGFAQIQVGQVEYIGSGCPLGSVSVTLSSDQRLMSLLFDDLRLEQAGSGLQQSSCNIRFLVTPPPNQILDVVQADFRGFVSIPQQTRAKINYDIYSVDMTNTMRRLSRLPVNYQSRTEEDFIHSVYPRRSNWWVCGEPHYVVVNVDMLVRSQQRGTRQRQPRKNPRRQANENIDQLSAFLSIDSSDLGIGSNPDGSGLNMALESVPCTRRVQPGRPNPGGNGRVPRNR